MKPGEDGGMAVARIDADVLGKLSVLCWVYLDIKESSRQMLPHLFILNLAL